MMDGSTKAVEHCFFASCNDSEKVVAQDKAFGFPAAQRSTLDLFNKGAFQKRWLVFPINVEQQHWVFFGVLNLLDLYKPQEEKFTAYFLYDSGGATTHLEDMTTLVEKGVMNVLVYTVYKYAESRTGPREAIKTMLMDEKHLPKIHLNKIDQIC